MNAPNSLPVLHRWCLAACLKFKFMSRRQPPKERDVARASQTDTDSRQTLLTGTLLLFPAIDMMQGKVCFSETSGSVNRRLAYMQICTLGPGHKNSPECQLI